jgi:mannose-6-phosphate isomerase-like protein (cupin superfamily)
MDSQILRPDAKKEFLTPERCTILEMWNDNSDPSVSIARARVASGVTTRLHELNVDERYVVLQGAGVVSIGELAPAKVRPGDVVVIPARTPQQITNTGEGDLVLGGV